MVRREARRAAAVLARAAPARGSTVQSTVAGSGKRYGSGWRNACVPMKSPKASVNGSVAARAGTRLSTPVSTPSVTTVRRTIDAVAPVHLVTEPTPRRYALHALHDL